MILNAVVSSDILMKSMLAAVKLTIIFNVYEKYVGCSKTDVNFQCL